MSALGVRRKSELEFKVMFDAYTRRIWSSRSCLMLTRWEWETGGMFFLCQVMFDAYTVGVGDRGDVFCAILCP